MSDTRIRLPKLDPNDLLIEDPATCGGLLVKPSPAVRITHKPTNVTVVAEDHRSYQRNKRDALATLSKLLEALT